MRVLLSVVAASLGLLLAFASESRAEATYTPIDFSAFHNANLASDVGFNSSGDVTLGGVPFRIPQGSRSYWHSWPAGGSNPRAITIPVNVENVSEVHTLINSYWGIPGPESYAHLEFEGSKGDTFRYDLLGNVNVRDYNENNGDWTNVINSPDAGNVWSIGGHRLDKQRIVLPAEFLNQKLLSVKVVDEGVDPDQPGPPFQRIFIAGLTVAAETLPPFSVELVQRGPRCVAVEVSSATAFRGGEVGVSFQPGMVIPVSLDPGDDLPSGSQLRFVTDPPIHCPAAEVLGGFMAGWIHPIEEPLLPAGKHEVLRVCFDFAEDVALEECSALRFVSCLGPAAAPARNVITAEDNTSITLMTEHGEVCKLPPIPFRRGDVNGDDSFDISDPIGLLGCLFLDGGCPRCPDLLDANDDGRVDISDPVYLLDWRFQGGSEPAPPLLECGEDPTQDELRDCEERASCN